MDKKTRETFTQKNAVLSDAPCLSEKKLVDDCYNQTGFDREACVLPIINYQTCKSFWGAVEKSRKMQNIKPSRPDAEERIKIKAYFRKHQKLPQYPMVDEPS